MEADVEEEIAYTRRLLENIREGVARSENEKIKEMYRRIKELLDRGEIRQIRSKDDEGTRFGHKTPTHQFFGYKTHIAMSEGRIVTGLEGTDGAQPDGLQLPALIENSKKNGVEVKEVVGDMAYVSNDNLTECEKQEVTLYAKTNTAAAAAARSSTANLSAKRRSRTASSTSASTPSATVRR